MKDWKVKDVGKVAFAVGFCFTIGRMLGKEIEWIFDSIKRTASKEILKHCAKNGDEYSQEICSKHGIKYETVEEKEEVPKMKIGFHN